MKFGKASLDDAECINRATRIIASTAHRTKTVVVTSAVKGVTASLNTAAHLSAIGNMRSSTELAELLFRRHYEIAATLIRDEARLESLIADLSRIASEVANMCYGVALLQELTPCVHGAIIGAGERLSARLVASALCELGENSIPIDATDLIITNDRRGQAVVDMKQTRERVESHLSPLIAKGIITIVTGFIGATSDGNLTTLGRGGSDYSAAILGSILCAEEIILWTDVDGIMTSDPKLVPEACTIDDLSYQEATELACFGTQVLNPMATSLIAAIGIPVWVRNSFAPDRRGTKIARSRQPSRSGVKTVIAIKEISLIKMRGHNISNLSGAIIEPFLTATNMIPNMLFAQISAQNDICIFVNRAEAKSACEALRRSLAVKSTAYAAASVNVSEDMAAIIVIGDNIRRAGGVIGRAVKAFSCEDIDIVAVAPGASENSVLFIVKIADMRSALAAVHREFNFEWDHTRTELVTRVSENLCAQKF